ncbi:MAG TPA: hypothetical protein DCZ03_10055 [Gammaproteobacteria bacterium]|nr:hypothetical protein [Gammaproteobacteria bacterium]
MQIGLRVKLSLPYLLIFTLLISVGPVVQSKPNRNNSAPDFSRLVIVGDSLSAGVQNLSLNENFQPNSYAALLAQQINTPLPLPLIAAPGVPAALTLVDPGPPPVLGQEPGESPGRIDPFLQPMNISVPNLKIDEVMHYRPDCSVDQAVGGIRLVDVYTELVLGLPACVFGTPMYSEVEMAEALDPSFAIIWIGNNDSLWAAVLGETSELTRHNVFKRHYRKLVKRVRKTGAQLLIANLPDVTDIGFLIPAETVAALTGLDLSVLGPILGIEAGDFVTLFAFEAITHILSGEMQGPLTGDLVVTASEISEIQAATARFNRVVHRVAARYKIPVVDIRGLLSDLATNGIVVNGQLLTTNYLGGIFSLDGFHPTNIGHAITANEFIKTINGHYNANIPLIDLETIQ